MSESASGESDGPVVVRTFGSRVEAQIVAGALRDAGIEAVLRADDLGGTDPALWMVRGVHLLVRPGDLDRARAVIESLKPIDDDSWKTEGRDPGADDG